MDSSRDVDLSFTGRSASSFNAEAMSKRQFPERLNHPIYREG